MRMKYMESYLSHARYDGSPYYGWNAEHIVKDVLNRLIIRNMQKDDLFKDKWILKGGACLSICYFENRFRCSNDLDFAFLEKDWNQEQIKEKFGKVCSWTEEQTLEEIKFDVSNISFKPKTERPGLSIPYTYILDESEKSSILEMEGAIYEEVFPPSCEEMIILWGDKPRIKCYSIEEVFCEMLRAIVKRNKKNELQPKHIFDIVHFCDCYGGHLGLRRENLKKIIGKKFEHEKLEFPKDLGELKRTLPTHFPLNSWEGFLAEKAYEAGHLKEQNEWNRPEWKEKFINDDMITHMRIIKCLIDCTLDIYHTSHIPDRNCFTLKACYQPHNEIVV